MIGPFETDDAHDVRFATGATGLLHTFNRAGVIEAADVHVADRIGSILDAPEAARLALAVTVRAVRHGSVCVDLAELPDLAPDLPWPDPSGWLDGVATGPLAARSVVRVDGDLLYLDRYWREESQVLDDLRTREAAAPPPADAHRLRRTAARVFGPGYDEQRDAALAAAGRWTTVLTGGPGTGKTTAVAGMLAMLAEQSEAAGEPLRIALAAPTGKAAARLKEAVDEAVAGFTDPDDRRRVGGLAALTLHRLLGWTPGTRTRFRHHRRNRLPHDVIVVDETSMVSLTMMARLLEAVRADCRLVLVGDPDQLASVEAGAVLGDLVAGLTRSAPEAVRALSTSHRFGPEIGELARCIRDGDADRVLALLRAGGTGVELVDPDDSGALGGVRATVLAQALAIRESALAGDAAGAVAALERHRLLCAHRDGPFGVHRWNGAVERELAAHTGSPIGAARGHEWYAGRPLLVTANDYGLDLYNGDTGVVVTAPDGGLRAVVAGGRHAPLATSRLADVETLHAMTVHKSQGSQADAVTVLLPPEDSPLLTRELFYTAVTRSKELVRVVGSEASVRAAVERRALRASGLASRLATH